jgi:succinoglycan biosynthesis transport protein ExoP
MQPVQMEPRDYLRALAKRWVFIALFTLAVTLAGGVYCLTMPAKFAATARVLVRGQESPVAVLVGGERRGLGTAQYSLATYAKLMVSSENARRVAERLAHRTSGEPIVADPSEIVQALSATEEPPDVIRVEAEASRPELAIAFANEAAESFVGLVGELQRAQETAARQFVEEQLARTSDEITRVARQLQQLRRQMNVSPVVAPAGEGEQGQYVNLLQRATDELAAADARRAALRAALGQVEAELRTYKPFTVQQRPAPNPLREQLQQQLLSYQAALAEMQTRYTADHPAVVDLQERIAELQKQIQALPATVSRTEVVTPAGYGALQERAQQLRQQLAEVEGQRSALQATVASLTRQAERAAQLEQQTDELQARLRLLRDVQQQLVADLQVHKMNEAVQAQGATVLDRAVAARSKTPRLSKALMFAFVLALAASCVLAIFFELIDDTIHDPDDLRRHTTLPYLGTVPRIQKTELPLVLVNAPKSPYAEAYRSLRSQINFRLWERPGKVLLVTSTLAGEGKTLTLCNLAVAYAQAGQTVLVFDADLRRPAAHLFFEVDNSRGFTNAIVGEAQLAEVMVETTVPGVRLVPSGPLPPNPAELLESERARQLLQQARELADVVFLDSPPCLLMTDAALLASQADHVILVVWAGHVRARELQQAREALEASRASLLGVVLNRVPITRGGYYYYYYYYYGYGPELAEAAAEPPGSKES